jgi:tRNA(adenine34) deaminase
VGLPETPVQREALMRLAIREAQRGMKEGEVPVGALVVLDGRIVARARNRPLRLVDPTAHAEILALRRAAHKLGNYRLTGCSLYVTIEPCAMCAGAIILARIRELIFGAHDLKAGACGSVLNVVGQPKLNHRVAILEGVLEEDCASLMQQFFRARRKAGSSLPLVPWSEREKS